MQNKEKNMTTENNHQSTNDQSKAQKLGRRRCLIKVGAIIIVFIIVLFIVGLILALTVFKPKEPKTELLSATLSGVSPSLSLPVVRIELNITLNLEILVKNSNYASFRHGEGKSLLLYRGNQVGEADIFPGNIPSRGSTTLPCRLTIEIEEFGSDLSGLIKDILSGELAIETTTRIPGRVTFIGFIKKHVVAVSVCQFTIGLIDMKVRSQVCKNKTET